MDQEFVLMRIHFNCSSKFHHTWKGDYYLKVNWPDYHIPAKMPEETEHIFEDLYKDQNSLARPGRVFYFSRHGESENNLYGKIGGDANLSVNGQKYANLLAAFLNQQDLKNIQVSHIY